MKWTLDSIGDESDYEETSLPQPREISRAALAAEDFDTQQFLTEHASFRSLQEMQVSVREWETKLHRELLNTVNGDFSDFVVSADSINNGESLLEGVRRDLLKFEESAQLQAQEFDEYVVKLEEGLRSNQKFAFQQCQGEKLAYVFKLFEDLESAVPETDPEDHETLITLSKLYVAMLCASQELQEVKAVQVLKVSFHDVRDELMRKLDESLVHKKEAISRMALLESREHVREAVVG